MSEKFTYNGINTKQFTDKNIEEVRELTLDNEKFSRLMALKIIFSTPENYSKIIKADDEYFKEYIASNFHYLFNTYIKNNKIERLVEIFGYLDKDLCCMIYEDLQTFDKQRAVYIEEDTEKEREKLLLGLKLLTQFETKKKAKVNKI